MKKGLLSLVGAGPGDPELLTIKAWKCLQKADIVLYDALVNPVLLKEIPKNTPKIYVGKRAGNHYKKQNEINQLILDCAQHYGHVVRLKGGDPFVFGRGHEEMTLAQSQGIEVDYIPGISSSIAAAGYCGIPVTKRGINESFWVVTASTRNGELNNDLCLAAQSSATIVILMGTKKLSKVVASLSIHRGEEAAIALIQNGTLTNQKLIIGNLGDIEQKAEEHSFSSPGIIVVGEVVSLHPRHLNTLITDLLEGA